MKPDSKTLYIVHCVDTEGPLHEPIEATFKRINSVFGLDLKPSEEMLKAVREGKGVPAELRQGIMEFVSADHMNYNADWTQLDAMVSDMMTDTWRNRHADDFGQGYILNWFILDHVGYESNPRDRALGFHAIFDYYKKKLKQHASVQDRLYWHYHPTPFGREANKSSNNFSCSNLHLEVFSRRLIDYLYFPTAYRPGCHTERPDINLFLEQWIPFDYGNQGIEDSSKDLSQKDLSQGRFGDWRRSPRTWGVYHPDFYDYQKPGNMKRYLARCLNLQARIRSITREEIIKAFEMVSTDKPTILSVTNHDHKEMRTGIDWFMEEVRDVQKAFPDVRIRHANAVDAIRITEDMPYEEPSKLQLSWDENRLNIAADKDIWGPQPFLAVKTTDQRYLHENLDSQGENAWSFTFDEESVPLGMIEYIGIGTNDNYGNSSAYRLTPDKDTSKTECRFDNAPGFTPKE